MAPATYRIQISGGEADEICSGPALFGLCPQAGSDGAVHCAGRTLVLKAPDGINTAAKFRWQVEPNTKECPLYALGMFLSASGQ